MDLERFHDLKKVYEKPSGFESPTFLLTWTPQKAKGEYNQGRNHPLLLRPTTGFWIHTKKKVSTGIL